MNIGMHPVCETIDVNKVNHNYLVSIPKSKNNVNSYFSWRITLDAIRAKE